MNFVAFRMLTGDRAKYFGLVFAIAFCTFLLENETTIFANIMERTASQILDVTDAEVRVMDPQTEYWAQTSAERHGPDARAADHLPRRARRCAAICRPATRRVHLNVASIAGYQPGGRRMAAYYATKAFVLSLSKGLAGDLRGSGGWVLEIP